MENKNPDNTDVKKAEEQIIQSEQKFRAMFDNANDGIVLADLESKKFHDANKAFCRMLGYSVDEIKTLGLSDIHTEKDLPYAINQFERLAKKEFELSKDIPVKRKDGSIFYADINASPVIIDEKTYLMGVFRDITDRKQAMETIRKNEAALREAQRLARIGSWDWDIATDVITWSEEYHYIIGHDPKLPTPNYQEHLKAYTSESAKRLDEAVTKAMKTGEPYELELELLNPKTETRWIIARGEAKFDAQKKIVGLRGTTQDITERKNNETRLNQTIRSLKTISKCNTVLVHAKNEQELLNDICQTVIDEGGFRMVWVGYAENDKEKNVRLVAEAGFTDNYPEIAHITWEDTERGRGPTGTAIRTGKICMVENMETDPNFGPWREAALKRGYASSVVAPLKIDGEIIGAINIYASVPNAFSKEDIALLSELAEDLSYGIKTLRLNEERHKIQEEVAKWSAYNRRLIEASLDPMVVIGPNGKITDVNAATIKITGRSAAELVNTDFSDYFTNPEKALACYEKGFKEGVIRNYPLEIKSKDGHVTPVLYNASVYKDENEKVVGVFATAHDISDLKQAESHIKELNELRGKFLNIMSHQLRTPLSAINWNLEMLLNGEFGKLDEIQKKFLESTHSASIKITNRIKDLLMAMDIEEGRVPLHAEEVALESIAGAVIQEAKKAGDLKGLKLQYDSKDSEFSAIQGDAEKIRSIITKLVENAVAYTKDGGSVTVSLSGKKNVVRFEVTDNGIGIPIHEQHRIFERFFRASNASVMQTDGFGLGLYIAKYFVEQHGGKIGFHSVENGGSTFWFEIPVQKD